MPAPHRLFFAIVPPEAVRARIARLALAKQQELAVGGRLLDPARYHVTLQFLGGFACAEPDELTLARAAGATLRFAAFDLVLDQLASFPRRQQSPFHLGCRLPPVPLLQLQRQLRGCLQAAGWSQPLGTAFVPHLTLAYGRRALPAPVAVGPIGWQVADVRLYRSSTGQPGFALLGQWPAT